MRSSEWIQAGFAVILALVAWLRPLPAGRRWIVTLLAVFALIAMALARLSIHLLAPVHVSILRDWLTVVLMPVPYWQTGQFFLGPDQKIQNRLAQIDRWLLNFIPRSARSFGPYTRLSLEWAYTLCYPLAPLGLAVLYIAGLRQYTGTFWFIVLVPTYLCYAITLFVPALPPRSITKDQAPAEPRTKSQIMNLWILKYLSIQAISFPSAHVASALAVSIVLLHYVPVAGVVFLAISFWIAVAAVVGKYHYASDVLLGALMALIVGAAWLAHLIPSSFITTPAVAFTAAL
jgi:membrane-associated phospholipid phosphatase